MKTLKEFINESKITTLRKNLITLIMSEKYNVEDDGDYHVLVVTKSDESKELEDLLKKIKTKKYFGCHTIVQPDKLLIAYDATYGYKDKFNKFREKYNLE